MRLISFRSTRRNAGMAGMRWLAMLALVAVMMPRPAAAADCRDFFADDLIELGIWPTPDGDFIDSLECVEYTRDYDLLSAFGGRVRIHIPADWVRSPHPEATAETMRSIAEALRDSLTLLWPHMRPYPIHAVVTDTFYNQGVEEAREPRPGDERDGEEKAHAIAVADIVTARTDGFCPLAIFIDGVVRRPPEDVKATIAHEVFHCFQIRAYQERARHYPANAWWMEGTASRFENFLYSCVNYESRLIRYFVPARSLVRQRYGHQNAIFFTQLESEHGAGLPQLFDFMARMAESEDEADQFAAFARYPDIAHVMDRFARAYLDRAIRDEDRDGVAPDCTGLLPLPPVETRALIIHEPRLTLIEEVESFAIGYRTVVLPADTDYRISIDRSGGEAGASAVSFRREDEPGAWTRVGERADADVLPGDCDEQPSYLLAITSTEPRTDAQTVRILFEEQESRIPASIRCGECPVGAWRRDVEHLNAKLNSRAPTVLFSYQGYMSLRLFPDGAVNLQYADFWRPIDNGHHVRWNGTSEGTWTLPGLIPGPVAPGSPEVATELERLNIRSIADLPQPKAIIAFDWTKGGVREVSSIEIIKPKEGRLGIFAPKGRYPFRCEGNDILDLGGGGRYVRER